MPRAFVRLVLVLLPAALMAAGAAAPTPRSRAMGGSQPTPSTSDRVVPIEPVRRGSVPLLPAAPVLPPAADQLAPLTLLLEVVEQPTKGEAQRTHRTVTRTVEKVHVRAETSEWLFERNPVDPTRVSGQRVDHGTREIVFYTDSDLRQVMGLWGWAHVLTLGFEHRLLGARAPGQEVRMVSDVPFNRMTLTAGSGPIRDVWWNAEHALPATFTAIEDLRSVTTTVVRLIRGVDTSVLQPPASRFPHYQTFDLAEWLEHR